MSNNEAHLKAEIHLPDPLLSEQKARLQNEDGLDKRYFQKLWRLIPSA
jgi:hypothetical protein